MTAPGGIRAHLAGQLQRLGEFVVYEPLATLQRVLAAAIAVSTGAVAAYFLPRLGSAALPPGLAWTLFMVTEAMGALGLITWRTATSTMHRWSGLAATTVALCASVAGMVTAHVTRTPPWGAPADWSGWDIGVAVIAVYPVAFVTSLHLLLGGREPRPERDVTTPRAERDVTPITAAAAGPVTAEPEPATAPEVTPATPEPEPVAVTNGRTLTLYRTPLTPITSMTLHTEPEPAEVPEVPPAPEQPDGTEVPEPAGEPDADEQRDEREAVELGVTLDAATPGETNEERSRRHARNRSRLYRARRARRDAEPEPLTTRGSHHAR